MQPLLASTVRIAATLHSDSVSRVGAKVEPLAVHSAVVEVAMQGCFESSASGHGQLHFQWDGAHALDVTEASAHVDRAPDLDAPASARAYDVNDFRHASARLLASPARGWAHRGFPPQILRLSWRKS